MKKYINSRYFFIIIFCFFYCTSFSQSRKIYKYKASQTCLIAVSEDGEYIEHTDWSNTNILVVIDISKNRFSIFAKKEINLDIIKALKSPKTLDKNSWFRWSCIDDDGTKCIVRQVIFKHKRDEFDTVLYIDYKDLIFVYRLKAHN